MSEPLYLDVTIRYTCGAYVTPTVRGQRASSTMSAGEAARKLAQKLWGVTSAVRLMKHLGCAVESWRIAPSPGGLED